MRGGVNLENLFNYSTDETPIGTWINGKTIYRKVINIGALPNAEQKVYTWNIPGIQDLVGYSAYAVNTNGNILGLPYVYPSEQYMIYWITIEYVAKGGIEIITGTDRRSFNGLVILEYTKNE